MDAIKGVLRQSTTAMSNTTTALLAATAILSYYYYRSVYGFFKRRGVPGPTPYPLLGNLPSMMSINRMEIFREFSKRYGKFYGLFLGTQPSFIVADAEVLRQICIKDFDAMPNHEQGPSLNDFQKEFIFFTQDDKWKRLRALQSPTFTSGKIKRMFKLLDVCADDLVMCLSEQLDKGDGTRAAKAVVNLKDIYPLYTLDAIATAAYSVKMQRKGASDLRTAATRDEFVDIVMEFFVLNSPRMLLSFILPDWLIVKLGLVVFPKKRFDRLSNRLKAIIDQRRGKHFDDYLQLLMDARLDKHVELNEMDDKENHHAGLTQDILQADQAKMVNEVEESAGLNGHQNGTNGIDSSLSTKAKLSEHEILSSAMFLLMVGVETTSVLLTSCTYALAFHSDIQERLHAAIKTIAKLNEKTGEYVFDYDELTSCEYLDAVISESLRLLSPFIHFDRVVSRDHYIEKYNVRLRKGDHLQLSFYSIMNDPDYWPEPTKFDPERFMGDNKKKIVPGSYCPFGIGPRHCLGMRFSLTEAKLALAKVLMRFKFTPAPNTVFPPKSSRNLFFNSISTPSVELSHRTG
jgi:cytochrome P450